MNFELTEEQKMLRDMAGKFAEQEMMPTLQEYEHKRAINYDIIKKMAELGMLGIHIPSEYGGVGLDYTAAAIIWEQLSRASWSQTLMSLGHSVLAGTVLLNAASEEQKQKYLPPLCRGEMIIAVGAVEPNAGSDAGAIETKAVLDGDDWVINGTKNFISAGSVADTVLVLVQTDKSLGARGIALIAVDKDTPGFSSYAAEMIGDRAGDVSNLAFVDCRVPKVNLIGKVGRGLQNALTGIDTARLFISAGAIGMAQSCLDASIKYTKERNQFRKPIASFQLVQEAIARIQAEIFAIRWLVYHAAELKSKGLPHGKELSSAKWLATELAVRSSAEAIRLHGAYGCTEDYPVAHHYRDAVLTTILGGTTEMHKLTIGRELLGINAMV
ncbi:MAG TPA: acyl-CoA dehydrogenase family protein, partial [Desulfobacteraceae bacterium]|nr:acyl-CoA dehydrogenase family protein [Desulfobacteraceae bacterium]HPJ67997.1 acyl-CoA dehydrogenase family protein [Desulfobacteraceae bacterium]HPQ28264.1 acyl-CoA dehydrogenase family protein [Desulfobacteraceae bacterium]